MDDPQPQHLRLTLISQLDEKLDTLRIAHLAERDEFQRQIEAVAQTAINAQRRAVDEALMWAGSAVFVVGLVGFMVFALAPDSPFSGLFPGIYFGNALWAAVWLRRQCWVSFGLQVAVLVSALVLGLLGARA